MRRGLFDVERALGCCALLVGCLTLSACFAEQGEMSTAQSTLSTDAAPSTIAPSSGGDMQGYDEFVDEYHRAIDELSDLAPEGYDFPADVTGDWDPDGTYEAGVGSMQAAFSLRCAWADEYELAATEANDDRDVPHLID